MKDKKIWLIGASTGIGEAVAKALAAKGARLVISSRNSENLSALLREIGDENHIALPLDVTDLSSIEAAWNMIITHHGIPDMVMYNAGIYEPMSAAEFDYEKAAQMLDVNFTGILRTLKCILPSFVNRKEGHILIVGSVAGYSGLPNAMGYGASKAAIIHLAENLYLDLTKHNIKVQLISPGFVKTRLTDKNSFTMPFIISTQQAADYIIKGIESEPFEISFPKKLSWALKLLRILPYSLYFRLMKHLK